MLNTFAKFTQYLSNIFQNLLNFSLRFALIFKIFLSLKMFSKFLFSLKNFQTII